MRTGKRGRWGWSFGLVLATFVPLEHPAGVALGAAPPPFCRGTKLATQEQLEALSRIKASHYVESQGVEEHGRIRDHISHLGQTAKTVPLPNVCSSSRGADVTVGGQVVAQKVIFAGNNSVPTEDLEACINVRTLNNPDLDRLPGVFGIIIWLDDGYSPTRTGEDSRKLEAHYHSLGYLDASVTWRLEHDSNGGDIKLIYQICEGTRYRLNDGPKVCGFPMIYLLPAICQMDAGDFYDEKAINADLERIREAAEGHVDEAKVEAVLVRPKEKPGVISVRYKVTVAPGVKWKPRARQNSSYDGFKFSGFFR